MPRRARRAEKRHLGRVRKGLGEFREGKNHVFSNNINLLFHLYLFKGRI